MNKKPKHKRKREIRRRPRVKSLHRTCVKCKSKRVAPHHHKFCRKCWINTRDIREVSTH